MGKKKRMKKVGREKELKLKESKSKRNWLLVITPIIVAIIGIGIFFALSGGEGASTPEPDGNGNTNGTTNGDGDTNGTGGNTVAILASEVDTGGIFDFDVPRAQGTAMSFMAYKLAGEIYVRASVCPPCRSRGFSLEGDILDCDSCHTRFEASTGEGISGACQDYPKAEVAHAISGGNITMSMDDLTNAYNNTVEPGWP